MFELVAIGGKRPAGVVMANFASEQRFCDMHVVLDDGTLIPCHRILMAAASEFIRLALADPMANMTGGARVMLPKTEARVFSKVAKFVYTGAVSVDDLEELDEVLVLAHFALFDEVVRACEGCYVNFVRGLPRLAKTPALLVNRTVFADGFGLLMLRSVCIEEVYQHIGALSRDSELTRSLVTGLDVDGIVEFLGGDGLHGGERVVFDFAEAWLEAHPNSDEAARTKVFETVRFCYLPGADALEIAEKHPKVLKLMCHSYVAHLKDATTPRGGVAVDDYSAIRRGEKFMMTSNAEFFASELRKYNPCSMNMPAVKRLTGQPVVVSDDATVDRCPIVRVDGLERTCIVRVAAVAEETYMSFYVPMSCVRGRVD